MKPRAFCELPAGLASVSLRLHGGAHCRPPISRMGNKSGYAEVILAALGLRSGEGAGSYVWAEADPDVRALLRVYPDAEALLRIADIIRGWKDEEPRALWERLRAERKARGPAADDGMAGWIVGSAWTKQNDPDGSMYMGPDRPSTCHDPGWTAAITLDGLTERCHRLAGYAQVVASNRLIHVAGPDLRNTGAGGTTFGGAEFATPAAELASKFERVAGWLQEQAQTSPYGQYDIVRSEGSHGWMPAPRGWVANRCEQILSRWPPVAVLPALPDAATLSALLGTPGDLEGVVVYSDPDYRNTTGYGATCRDLIPDLARGWDAAGAVVCVSEAEPLPELPGWFATEITAGRRGQKRTFSKQQHEFLTMNREPAHRVATQVSMFGGTP